MDIYRNVDFLNAVFENLPNMVFVKEARELRFVMLNKAGEELLGYRREDLIGKNDYDFFPREQADFFTSIDRDVLSSGNGIDIPEEEINTKEKGKRLLHTKKLPISGINGRSKYLLGISEDVTERREIMTRLASYSRMPENNPAPVLKLNKDLVVALANGSALKYFGDDALGKKWARLNPGINEGRLQSMIGKDDLWSEEVPIKGRVLLINHRSVLAAEEIFVYCSDVTDLRQAEVALRKRNDELTRLNNLMVGRELKMIELKKEIRRLGGQ